MLDASRLLCAAVAALVLMLAGQVALAQETPAADAPTAETQPQAQPTDAPTPEDAEAAAAAPEEEVTSGEAFVRTLIQGGWTMFFLLIVSIFGLAYAIERFVNLRRRNIAPQGLAESADELYKRGDLDGIRRRMAQDSSTLARMIEAIVQHRRQGAAAVSTISGDIAARDLKRHLQRAYPLAVVATLSPLLGLLGTVIGMIGAFGKVAAAGSLGDASILGGDISKALVTTGAGLGIAVPALALYHYFKARTSLFSIDLEEQGSALITDWFDLDQEEAPRDRVMPRGRSASAEAPAAASTPGAPTPANANADRQAGVSTTESQPQRKEPAHAD